MKRESYNLKLEKILNDLRPSIVGAFINGKDITITLRYTKGKIQLYVDYYGQEIGNEVVIHYIYRSESRKVSKMNSYYLGG